MSTPVSLEALNAMPAAQASEHLLACCTSERWIHNVTSGRPYGSVGEILARSDESVAGLDRSDLEQALAGHPRIGAGSAAGPSRQEQAGVQAADQATLRALAEGNEAYEQRFGHVYLVCATGRSAGELLALLRERLGHDPGTEWGIVRRELGKINRIRLRRLLEGTA
jgi:2-oxo-4-hydroxy-4-carboxy-5-ureidoimidazoline decarboxylase